MNRREFLETSAVTGAAVAADAVQAAQQPKTYRLGVIGCGWYGMVNCRHAMNEPNIEVTALCDVDSQHLRAAADEVEKRSKRRPATFGDFRAMLKPKSLDIVIVGTPDHWHALTTIAALEAGADVYVEKPICHTYLEGRAMLQAARKHKRVVQVGTQRRSTPHIQSARDFFRKGNLGRVGMARAFCYWHVRSNQNPPDEQSPKHLDFEMWTGPAPLLKYNRLFHPRQWRNFSEFGNGIVGDMGIHMLDTVRWFMDIGYPRRVSSTGGIYVLRGSRPNITDTQTVTFDYPDSTVIWEHRAYGRAEHRDTGWGVTFYGERGSLQLTLDGWDFFPQGKGTAVHEDAQREKVPDERLEPPNIAPAGRAHWRNFLECVRTRNRPVADIEEGHISTAMCQLGNMSQQLGRSITWDAQLERCTGDDAANRLLRRDYRKPWVYPGD
jgi:predicted dehydrogenase